jgi:hypothetical protein
MTKYAALKPRLNADRLYEYEELISRKMADGMPLEQAEDQAVEEMSGRKERK